MKKRTEFEVEKPCHIIEECPFEDEETKIAMGNTPRMCAFSNGHDCPAFTLEFQRLVDNTDVEVA